MEKEYIKIIRYNKNQENIRNKRKYMEIQRNTWKNKEVQGSI